MIAEAPTGKTHPKTVVRVALAVLVVAGSIGYYVYSRQPTYTTYGTEVVTTTAPLERWAEVLHQTAWELGDCIAQEDGKRHLPSFHQGGRSWKDERGNIIAIRGITEFDDKNGNHCVIEDIVIPGKPAVILLKSDSEAATAALANNILQRFRELKIRPK
ncbi:MAG TPA: hypothetical protein VMX13_03825 [Sedimentisphaerales bacterium]|nr:hypothetical protein [Sedimentisphaerales bacterium]